MRAIRLFIGRRLSTVLVASVLLTLLGAAQPAAAATGVSGVQRVPASSALNSKSFKTAAAYCPPNKRVIGGGASTVESGGTHNTALTELRPVRLYDGTRDAYVFSAVETELGTPSDWQLVGYAICADPLPGMHIASASTAWSSSSVQATAASCSGGWVIGTGGRILTFQDPVLATPNTASSLLTGGVVLQVARPSQPGDIARVQAHETASGYAGNWSVTAYAVCVPTKPAGYKVVFAQSAQRLSESEKKADAFCSVGSKLLSAGAAISNVAPGNVALATIDAVDSGDPIDGMFPSVHARAVENTPTSQNWDFIVATAICANGA